MLTASITGTAMGEQTDLITSGQRITLFGPSADYLYQWSAEVDGSTIAQGASQTFAFTAPTILEGNEKKTIQLFMLVRTAEGGCANQTTAALDVYALPACGISGPSNPSPEEKATYNYSGGTTGDLNYDWSVDGSAIPGQGGSVIIDWSKYSSLEHTVGLKITKDYSADVPGAMNPTRAAECTYSVTLEPHPMLALTKKASSSTANVGEVITYTYNITNTGDVTIRNLRLYDDRLGDVAISTSTLLPGQMAAATAAYTVRESDLPGPLVNNATTAARDPKGKVIVPANASAAVTLIAPVESLNLTKTASSASANVGDIITYTYTVMNTGTLTISALQVNDDKLNTINFQKNSLVPGESATTTASYVVRSSDLPGPLINNATTIARDPSGKVIAPAKASASVSLIHRASISLSKTPSASIARVGDKITYTYSVKNTGNVALSNLVITDDKLGQITISPTSLPPGQSVVGRATYTVLESDLPGPLVNNVTAVCQDEKNCPVSNETKASVELVSPSGCLIDGSGTLCQGELEMYAASTPEGPDYTYRYSWKVDGKEIGTESSIELLGGSYALGVHSLELTVSTTLDGQPLSTEACSKEVKVMPTPDANFTIRVL